jgi:endonuclease-3
MQAAADAGLCYHEPLLRRKLMPRGNVPRQPSRSGRQEGARKSKGALTKKSPTPKLTPKLKSASAKNAAARASGRASTPGAKALLPKKKSASGVRDAASPVSTYDPVAPERVRQIIAGLDQMYPNVTCALAHHSAWELVVATILSAQSTDVRVNMVTPGLFKKYPTVQDFAALEPEQLQPDIYSTGFFRNKSKSVVGAARKVVAEFGGNVPQTMEELLTLPGVARKTANVVLGTWFKKNEGVVVDTHVTRIARRLELTTQQDARKIEEDLMLIIPRERWTDFSHEVIWHGRRLCVARGPKCADCGIEKLCHAADKTWSTVEIHPGAKG